MHNLLTTGDLRRPGLPPYQEGMGRAKDSGGHFVAFEAAKCQVSCDFERAEEWEALGCIPVWQGGVGRILDAGGAVVA